MHATSVYKRRGSFVLRWMLISVCGVAVKGFVTGTSWKITSQSHKISDMAFNLWAGSWWRLIMKTFVLVVPAEPHSSLLDTLESWVWDELAGWREGACVCYHPTWEQAAVIQFRELWICGSELKQALFYVNGLILSRILPLPVGYICTFYH